MAFILREGVFPEAFAALEQNAFERPWLERAFSPTGLGISFWQDTSCLCFIYARQTLDELEIYRVATHRDHRRKGLALKAMEQLHSYCSQNAIARVILEVASKNSAAVALYQQQGFKHSGTRRRYYSDGDDALLMELLISAANLA